MLDHRPPLRMCDDCCYDVTMSCASQAPPCQQVRDLNQLTTALTVEAVCYNTNVSVCAAFMRDWLHHCHYLPI